MSQDIKSEQLREANPFIPSIKKCEDRVETASKKYPKVVFFIFTYAFCERFAYYGVRVILYIYLTELLGINRDTSTAIYHAFPMMCCFVPIFGAILADGYIGLYRTLLYVSCFYFIGEAVITLTSIGPLGAPNVWGTTIGLLLIALDAGGKEINIAS
jgi:solute carrier family 15 oligopeptide transporter 1